MENEPDEINNTLYINELRVSVFSPLLTVTHLAWERDAPTVLKSAASACPPSGVLARQAVWRGGGASGRASLRSGLSLTQLGGSATIMAQANLVLRLKGELARKKN